MTGYTSYYLYAKYEKRGDQGWLPAYPNVFSVDGDGTMPLVKKMDDDPNCGYVPPPVSIYRWVELDPTTDYICSDCNVKAAGTYNSGQTFTIDCDSATTLTSADISGLTNIEYVVVGGCVTSIGDNVLSGFDTLSGVTLPSTITSIGRGSFSGNVNLTDCEIPSGVTSIGIGAFIDCQSLQSVILWDSITEVGQSAFTNCDNITSIHISTAMTIIPNSFCYLCGALSEVIVPDNITQINASAFRGCIGLFNAEIGSGVTNIESNAFDGCSGLTSIIIRATEPPTIGTNVFRDTNNANILVPASSVDTYKAASGWSDYASRIQAITQ